MQWILQSHSTHFFECGCSSRGVPCVCVALSRHSSFHKDFSLSLVQKKIFRMNYLNLVAEHKLFKALPFHEHLWHTINWISTNSNLKSLQWWKLRVSYSHHHNVSQSWEKIELIGNSLHKGWWGSLTKIISTTFLSLFWMLFHLISIPYSFPHSHLGRHHLRVYQSSSSQLFVILKTNFCCLKTWTWWICVRELNLTWFSVVWRLHFVWLLSRWVECDSQAWSCWQSSCLLLRILFLFHSSGFSLSALCLT